MTQEEKFKEAKRLYKTANADQKYVLESLFPELKESEDEKIRKELITHCRNTRCVTEEGAERIAKWIAWLEKQGGHAKFINGIQVGDKVTRNEDGVIVNLSQLNRVAKKLGEQNPAWSEEDEKMVGNIRSIIEKYAFSQSAVDVNGELCEKEYIEADNWLKSLKDRVQPQPRQEWSQNDIDMIDWLIRCCEKEHEELCNDKYGHQDIVSDLKRDCRKKWNWLESLRNKVVPQNRWKPSDEQMEALDFAADCIVPDEFCFKRKVLKELLEQLKKLKDEK